MRKNWCHLWCSCVRHNQFYMCRYNKRMQFSLMSTSLIVWGEVEQGSKPYLCLSPYLPPSLLWSNHYRSLKEKAAGLSGQTSWSTAVKQISRLANTTQIDKHKRRDRTGRQEWRRKTQVGRKDCWSETWNVKNLGRSVSAEYKWRNTKCRRSTTRCGETTAHRKV